MCVYVRDCVVRVCSIVVVVVSDESVINVCMSYTCVCVCLNVLSFDTCMFV